MQKIITRIEPLPAQKKKRRVAAYCRVSSDRDTQLTSLNNQREHYESLIIHEDDWEFVGIYYEEGLSGTKQETRPELQRMIADCKAGRIDLIYTKSISRFARNTADCLELVRLLTSIGVEIYFEKENLSTASTESELFLAILASLAEEESRSISENGKWAIQKRYKNGTFKLSRPPYGYDLVDGQLIINEEEAVTVRYIFDCVLSGIGTTTIAAELNRRQVPTKRGGSWHPGTIQNMIKNVIFCGDLLMQKTYHDSRFRLHLNHGEADQYYLTGHHDAIIPRERFEAANEAYRQRGREKNNIPREDKSLRDNPHHNRYCFTGKLHCRCGDRLKRQTTRRSDGIHASWVCKTHLKDPTQCTVKRIWEENIQHAFLTMLNKLAYSRAFLLQPFIREIEAKVQSEKAVQLTAINQTLQKNNDEKHRLRLHYAQGSIDPVFFRQEISRLKSEELTLRQERESLIREDTKIQSARALDHYLSAWHIGAPDFPTEAFTEYVDHVQINSREELSFVLKCGLTLTESLCADPADRA